MIDEQDWTCKGCGALGLGQIIREQDDDSTPLRAFIMCECGHEEELE